VRVQFLVFGPVLVDAVPVFVGHAFEGAHEVLVLAVQLRVARVVFGQPLLELLDFLVQPVDAPVLVLLFALEALPGVVQLLVLVVEAQFQLLLLQVDVVEVLVGLLQLLRQGLVVLVDVLERVRVLLGVLLELLVVLFERLFRVRPGLALLGEFEVVEVDLVLEVVDLAFLLLNVFPHGRQTHFLLAFDLLGFVLVLRLHFFLCSGLVVVTLAQLLSVE